VPETIMLGLLIRPSAAGEFDAAGILLGGPALGHFPTPVECSCVSTRQPFVVSRNDSHPGVVSRFPCLLAIPSNPTIRWLAP